MKCVDCGFDNIAGEDACAGCGSALPEKARPAPRGLAERVRSGSVADLRPRPAVAVPPDATVAQAARLMREEKVGAVLVAKGGRMVGIMTERDLLNKVAGLRDPAKVPVSEVMHAGPESVAADEPVTHAFHMMSVGGYRHVPVRQDDGSTAMVSSRDLLAFLAGTD